MGSKILPGIKKVTDYLHENDCYTKAGIYSAIVFFIYALFFAGWETLNYRMSAIYGTFAFLLALRNQDDRAKEALKKQS